MTHPIQRYAAITEIKRNERIFREAEARKEATLAYSHSFDADLGMWIVTEEFVSGYTVIAEFTTKEDAQNYIRSVSNEGRR